MTSTAVSLLARVILPRPGEPLDVRKLYIEESTTNARRAHATTRTTLQIGAESEVSFSTYFNAFPASYWRRWSTLGSVVLRVELTGTGRVDIYRTKATGARIFIEGRNFTEGAGVAGVRARPRSVRRRRLDLVRRHHRQRRDPAQRGLVRAGGCAGRREHRGRHPDVQPARRLRCLVAGLDGRSVGGPGDRRGHRAGPGHRRRRGITRAFQLRPPHWAIGSRSTTSRTSAVQVVTAG